MQTLKETRDRVASAAPIGAGPSNVPQRPDALAVNAADVSGTSADAKCEAAANSTGGEASTLPSSSNPTSTELLGPSQPDGPSSPGKGSLHGSSASVGSQPSTNPGGSQSSTNLEGSQPSANPGGSQTSNSPGGSQSTNPGESQPSANPGGSQPSNKPGGCQPSANSGGSQPSKNPGGAQPSTNPGGSQASANPGGSQPSTKPGVSQPSTSHQALPSITGVPGINGGAEKGLPGSDDICPVCQERLGVELMVLPCGHMLCCK